MKKITSRRYFLQHFCFFFSSLLHLIYISNPDFFHSDRTNETWRWRNHGSDVKVRVYDGKCLMFSVWHRLHPALDSQLSALEWRFISRSHHPLRSDSCPIIWDVIPLPAFCPAEMSRSDWTGEIGESDQSVCSRAEINYKVSQDEAGSSPIISD